MKTVQSILKKFDYSQQIKSDEWKKFSKSVRDIRHVCECCRIGTSPLQVHHLFYEQTRDLWDYKNEEVVVLCRDCHEKIHVELQVFRTHVFRYLSPANFKLLNGALSVALTQYSPIIFLHALLEFVGNERLVYNHAKAYGFKNSKGDLK